MKQEEDENGKVITIKEGSLPTFLQKYVRGYDEDKNFKEHPATHLRDELIVKLEEKLLGGTVVVETAEYTSVSRRKVIVKHYYSVNTYDDLSMLLRRVAINMLDPES